MEDMKCDFCEQKNEANTPFCTKCGEILPCEYGDYFAALGVQMHSLEPRALEHAFLRKIAQLHPDRFALASQLKKERAMQHSAYLNQAYTTLKSDFLRLGYILRLKTHEPS